MDGEEADAKLELPESTDIKKYKIAAIVLSMCALVYGAATHEKGTLIFSLSSSIMAIFAVRPPSEMSSSFTARVFGMMNRALRNAFQYGDRAVRMMMIILAIGGSALVCKYGITEFSLFPKYVDVIVKRLGAFLAIVILVIYPASIISKRIYYLSERKLDKSLRQYELMFYVAVVLFCITVFISFAGFQIEDPEKWLPSNASPDSPIFAKEKTTILPGFDFGIVKLLWWICLTWLVWVIGLASCIISRFFERSWRIDVAPAEAPSSVISETKSRSARLRRA